MLLFISRQGSSLLSLILAFPYTLIGDDQLIPIRLIFSDSKLTELYVIFKLEQGRFFYCENCAEYDKLLHAVKCSFFASV